MSLPRLAAMMILLAALPAAARRIDDADLEIAQRRFQKGSEFYASKDYSRAIEEFEAARRVMPAPEIDFNIARCHDRLEHLREAVAGYQRYLAEAPTSPDADAVRARMQVLAGRLAGEEGPSRPSEPPPHATAAPPPTPPLPSPSPRLAPSVEAPRVPEARSDHRFVLPLALGAGALALALVGTALVASVDGDFTRLRDTCPRPCQDPLEADLKTRANVGYVMWGVAGAAALIDVVWFTLAARAHRDRPRAWLAPGPGGLLAGGKF